jgi:hypothetical protein
MTALRGFKGVTIMKVVSHEVILEEIPSANTLHSASISCKLDNGTVMRITAGSVFMHSETLIRNAEVTAIEQAKKRCFKGSYKDFLKSVGDGDWFFYRAMYCAEQYVLGLEV